MKGTARTSRNTKRRREVLRNRIIMFLLALSIAAGIGIFGTSSLVDAHDNSGLVSSDIKCYKSIELQEGDTLWNIAETYMDDSYDSINDYISELKKINNLDSDEIHEGHYLMVAYNK